MASQVRKPFQHRSRQEPAFVLLFQSDWRQLLCVALAQKETRYNPSKIITEHKYDDVDFGPTEYGERGRWHTRKRDQHLGRRKVKDDEVDFQNI